MASRAKSFLFVSNVILISVGDGSGGGEGSS